METRTPDLRFWRPSLYQLSYTPKADASRNPNRGADQGVGLCFAPQISHERRKRPFDESNLVPSLRSRLQKSPVLAAIIARVIGTYLRFCHATTRWDITGVDGLARDLAKGPILLVMWHERSLMGPLHWPLRHGQLSSLHASSAIGRVSGAMQRQFGLRPMKMSDRKSNVAASRQVLQRVREGVSIGMTGDGPLGPALVVKDAPLDWARAMQQPVYTYAFATTRHWRLKAWDKMMVPLPFGRGAVTFNRWEADVPRKADLQTIARLRASLDVALRQATARVDDALK